jgi:hypothetical protein
MRAADRKPAHVLFVGNSALYFILHRIGLARALVARGYRVGALLPAPVSVEHRATVADAGIAIYEYPYKPAGMNPLVEVRTLFALWRHYRDLKPDIVHHLTLKPSLYGGAVSRWLGTETRIQSIMGLGFLFNATNLMPRTVRTVLSPAFRYALGGRQSILTLENSDDCERLRAHGSLCSNDWPRVEILPGSGVDPNDHDPDAKPEEPPIVAFAGRLTRSKASSNSSTRRGSCVQKARPRASWFAEALSPAIRWRFRRPTYARGLGRGQLNGGAIAMTCRRS